MCKALGRRTSRREVNAVIAAQLGKGFRPSEVAAVLSCIREPLRNQHVTSTGTSKRAQNGKTGTSTGTSREPATLINVTNNNLVDSLRSSTRNGKPSRGERNGRPIKLPFDRDTLDLRNAILKAVWQKVEPIIGRSTSFTDWRKRNATIARTLAERGYTTEKAVLAWEISSQYFGEPVREFSMIQRFLEKMHAHKAQQQMAAQV